MTRSAQVYCIAAFAGHLSRAANQGAVPAVAGRIKCLSFAGLVKRQLRHGHGIASVSQHLEIRDAGRYAAWQSGHANTDISGIATK